jgi:hypothetical protein
MKPQPFNRMSGKQVLAAQLRKWRVDLELTLRAVSRVYQLSCWERAKNTPLADAWVYLRDYYEDIANERAAKDSAT